VLQVQAEHRDDTITVVVQDSGPGFSENTLDKIFEAFFTVKPGGMGLGLATCRMIALSANGFSERGRRQEV
jgi:signal transduction histidine kinase